MYNDQLVFKVVIWAFFGISLWTENVALIWIMQIMESNNYVLAQSKEISYGNFELDLHNIIYWKVASNQ